MSNQQALGTESAGDRLNSIDATVARIPVSRSTLYLMINTRQLRSVKVGGRRFVPESAINEYLAGLTDGFDERTA